jgi:hypothetical protein
MCEQRSSATVREIATSHPGHYVVSLRYVDDQGAYVARLEDGTEVRSAQSQASSTIETAAPPSAPIRVIDTSPRPSGLPFACAGVGLVDATLQGDPTDPRVAWIEMKEGGARDVVFPKGFTARFAPDLQVYDSNGQLRFRDGTSITGACVGGDGLLVGYP